MVGWMYCATETVTNLTLGVKNDEIIMVGVKKKLFLDHLIGTIHPEYSSAEESNFQIQQGPRQARNTVPGGHQSMPAFLPGTPAPWGLHLPRKPLSRISDINGEYCPASELSMHAKDHS